MKQITFFRKFLWYLTTLSPLFAFSINTSQMQNSLPESYEQVLNLGHGTVESASWSPDGQLIAVSGSQGIWIYDENYDSVTHLEMRNTQTVVWSPNGSQLAVAGGLTENDWDSAVYLWDVISAAQLHRLVVSGYSSEITAITWNPDSSQIAASGGGSIWVWDTQTGDLLRTLDAGGWTNALAWSPSGELLVSANNQVVFIWNTDTWDFTAALSITQVNSIAWNPESSQFALVRGTSVENDNSLQIWDVNEPELMWTAQAGLAQTVAWRSDGLVIATGSGDGSVRVWDVSTAALIARLQGHTRPVKVVQWRPGENQLLSAAEDNTLRLWNVSANQPSNTVRESEILAVHSGGVTALAWSPDNSAIVTGSEDGNVRIWDTETHTAFILGDQSGEIRSVEWSPNGQFIASAASETGFPVKIWDVTSGHLIYQSSELHLTHQDIIVGMNWSTNSRYLTFSLDQGVMFIWDTLNSQLTEVNLPSAAGGFYDLTWSSAGDRIAAISSDTSVNFIHVYDMENNRALLTIPCEPCRFRTLAWSPDGMTIAGSGEYGESGGAIIIWNTQTGRLIHILQSYGTAINGLAWGEGNRIAAIHGNTIEIWNAISGEKSSDMRQTASVNIVRWSTDGTRLALGNRDGAVQIWERRD